MGGIAIAALGVWVLVQVLGGDALDRLGLTGDDVDGADLGGGSGGGSGGDDGGGFGGGSGGGGGGGGSW